MEQFYKILNITENSSREEIDASYQKLKAEYTEKMFLEGEEGAKAASFLRELDNAYQDSVYDFNQREHRENGGSKYAEVENAIKDNNLEKAQSLLDSYSGRDSEWHYYQSNLFFKKNWYTDSKKQLEIALQLDPNNEKAKASLDGLDKIMQGEKVEEVQAEKHRQAEYRGMPQQQMGGIGCNCCDCLCASLLCNMCGGC